MNETYELRTGESHIEVHKFFPGAILVATVTALVLQASVPVYMPRLNVIELPLLVTIYFGLSRRNPSTGLLLGTAIGLAQDALSGPTVPLGYYGIAKTIVGYLASSIGARLDTEHPAARFALTFGFFVLHQAILVLIRRLLLAQPEAWMNVHLAIAAAVNALVGTLLFLALDRLRRRS
jgi:rod shape-determining protein MreD